MTNPLDEQRSKLRKKYHSLEKLRDRINDAIDNKYLKDGTPDFFIQYRGEIAGVFEVHPMVAADYLEIGFWLFAEYRRKGIIGATMQVMIPHLQQKFPHAKIVATTDLNNTPSQRLLLKCGFAPTGRILEFENNAGTVDKEVEYSYLSRS